jgi:glycosyltransferase involved in cell wall biosynthesis
MRKKKILFISEAAYLNTGYAKYSKEVISRIHNAGKHEIAEFSIYGYADDTRRLSIPWKNYANMPDIKNEKHVQAYNSNTINQFGSWRFERVCLDFEPDIIFTIRDFWMDSFIYHSPFRRIFSWAWMPTVDASPQNQEWIDMFADADYILTYSDWAKKLLEEQGGSKINTVSSAPPSASECFVPMNKEEARKIFNIQKDINIIGTVMRNQRRKLFPTLFQSFRRYLDISQSKNTFLYIHTSFPDSGWNIAQLLHDNNISSRVLMTYVCEKCKEIEVSYFRDSKKVCNKCRSYSSSPASVGNGVPDEELAKIYNVFDLYIQCANSEGFGLPQVEAAACGIPIACTNYSAMKDLVDHINAYPIDFNVYKELETGCDRAVPIIESIANIFSEYFSQDKNMRKEKSLETRSNFEKKYSWEKTAEVWMKVADECKYADWNQPPLLIQPSKNDLKNPSTLSFVKGLLNSFCYYEPHKNSHFSRSILTDLRRGMSKASYDSFYVSEFSPYANNKPKSLNREMIEKMLQARLNNYNSWEAARSDRTRLIDSEEKWLNS